MFFFAGWVVRLVYDVIVSVFSPFDVIVSVFSPFDVVVSVLVVLSSLGSVKWGFAKFRIFNTPLLQRFIYYCHRWLMWLLFVTDRSFSVFRNFPGITISQLSLLKFSSSPFLDHYIETVVFLAYCTFCKNFDLHDKVIKINRGTALSYHNHKACLINFKYSFCLNI